MAAGVFSCVLDSTSVSTAITLVQLKCGTTHVAEILRAWVHNTDVETSNQLEVVLVRKSAAATVTSFTPIKHLTGSAAAEAVGGTAATGHTATAEGTNTDIYPYGMNILNGWEWVPVPEERLWVAPAAIIAVKLFSAPASATVISAGITWREYP